MLLSRMKTSKRELGLGIILAKWCTVVCLGILSYYIGILYQGLELSHNIFVYVIWYQCSFRWRVTHVYSCTCLSGPGLW